MLSTLIGYPVYNTKVCDGGYAGEGGSNAPCGSFSCCDYGRHGVRHKRGYSFGGRVRRRILSGTIIRIVVGLIDGPGFTTVVRRGVGDGMSAATVRRRVTTTRGRLQRCCSVGSGVVRRVSALSPSRHRCVVHGSSLSRQLCEVCSGVRRTRGGLVSTQTGGRTVRTSGVANSGVCGILVYFRGLCGIVGPLRHGGLVRRLVSRVRVCPRHRPGNR